MSESNAEPSLIQQRMALQRKRSWAIYTIVFSAVMLTGSAVVLLLDGGPWRFIGIALFLVGIGLGIVEYRRAATAIRDFEDRHGPGAGTQP